MAEKGLFIEALPRDGVVTFLALVKEKELRPKRTGGWYLYLLLSDRTGELQAKAWDQPQQTAALFERDDIVKVRGAVELYNDHPQLIVQRIRRCAAEEFQEARLLPGLSPRSRRDVPRAAGLCRLGWKRLRSVSIAVGPE